MNYEFAANDLSPRCVVLEFLKCIVTCISDYRRGFGLDDWIYYTLYIHRVLDYR
jgi:hypothetical protein